MEVYVAYLYGDDKILAVARDLKVIRMHVEGGYMGKGKWSLVRAGSRWSIERKGKSRGFVEKWVV